MVSELEKGRRLPCGCIDVCTDQRPGHPSTAIDPTVRHAREEDDERLRQMDLSRAMGLERRELLLMLAQHSAEITALCLGAVRAGVERWPRFDGPCRTSIETKLGHLLAAADRLVGLSVPPIAASRAYESDRIHVELSNKIQRGK